MIKNSLVKRRQIRALEAKRDRLLEQKAKATSELAKLRAELRVARKSTS